MADSNETVTIATGEGASGTRLLGIGAYRPERVVSNEEICEKIDSTTEWIYERSPTAASPGLRRRSSDGQLGGGEAVKSAIDVESVAAMIVCSSTYEA